MGIQKWLGMVEELVGQRWMDLMGHYCIVTVRANAARRYQTASDGAFRGSWPGYDFHPAIGCGPAVIH
jgi:hypothetical protein